MQGQVSSAKMGLPTIIDWRVIVWHLLPGVLVGLGYTLFAPLLTRQGIPNQMALFLSWTVIGLPFLIATLWRQRRQVGAKVLLYRQPLPRRQMVGWVFVLLLWSLVTYTLLTPLSNGVREMMFDWLPDWFVLTDLTQSAAASHSSWLLIVAMLSLLFNLIVPFSEELYFREYLFSRLPGGRWSPLVNVVLFSLYHVWLPWEFLNRLVALLPMAYVVQRTKNVYVAVWVHVLLNSLGSVGLLVWLLSQ